MAGLSAGPPIDSRLRVTVNFHPDRPTRDGMLVIQALARDEIYRSQFVTGPAVAGWPPTRAAGWPPTRAATAGSGSSCLFTAPTTTGPPNCA
jgi:hypothetical protein